MGHTAITRSRGRARAQLKTARERRYREATPEHQARPLPRLISARDLTGLRRSVPVVSRSPPPFLGPSRFSNTRPSNI